MSAIYACAVMNAKIRIIGNLLSNTKLQTGQSNFINGLKNQLTRTRKDIDKRGCREVSENTASLSIKKLLLDNTTYQYCTYRQYLYYLDTASKKSLATYYKTANENGINSGNLLTNTD